MERLLSPSCCDVWESFSSYSSPSLKHLETSELSQKPLWVGVKASLDLCVVFSHYLIIFFNYFLIVTSFFIIFLNPNSSFFSINKPLPLHFSVSSLLSLLRLLGFWLFGEQECFLQVCIGVWLVCLVGA